MSTPAIVEERQLIQAAADRLSEFLGLKKISIVCGGPSPSDPEGIIKWYMGFNDGKNGFHFAVDEEGNIVRAGASIGGKRYEIPEVKIL